MNTTKDQAESKPRPRRRLLRIILGALAAMVIIFIALVVFIQTNFAFQQLIVPVAARALNGDLEIEKGSISLRGGVSLHGIRLANMPPIESFTADSIDAKVSLASLMGGGVPRIESVEVINPQIVVNDAMEGGGESEKEEDADEEKKSDESGRDDGPMVPVAVDFVKIENLNATMKSGERIQARLNKVNFSLADLAPGSAAEAKLNADFDIAPDEAQARSGTLALNLKVEQPADGRSFKYEGTSVAAVQEGRPRPDGGVLADLQLDMQTLQGTISRDGVIQCSLQALATAAKEQAGSVNVALDYDPKNNKIQGDIEVSKIGREVLNPILAMYGPSQIETARFDTKITVQNDGDAFRFLSKVTGKDLSVRPEKGQEATPKLDITSEHAGLWNPKTKLLTVEKADVNILREGVQVGTAGLDQALKLDLDTSKGDSTKALAPEEAHVTVQIQDLEVDNVRAWMKALNSDALDQVRSGGLNGKLTATIHGAGETIDWVWDAGLANLRIRPEEDGETLGPFKITQQLSGALKDLKSITLNPGTIVVQAGDGEILNTSISGKHELESGSTDLKIVVASPNIGRAMKSAGVMKDDEKFGLRDGAFSNEVVITRGGTDDAILVTGTVKAEGVTLVADGSRTLGQSLASSYEFKLNAKEADIEINRFEMTMRDGGGAEAGKISAEGFWPLGKPDEDAKGERGGRATAKIVGVSAAPWIKFLDLGDGRDLGSVPVNGNLAVSMDPAGEKFTYEGQWDTTLRMDNGGVSEDVKVTIENSVRKLNDQIESFVADLNATRKTGAADKVSIQGKGKLGDRPAFQGEVKVTSLDAGFYADVFGPKKAAATKEGATPTDGQVASVTPTPEAPKTAKTTGKAEDFPADMNLTFAVDSMAYRGVRVAGMTGSIKSDAKNLNAKLDGMKLNEGSMTGHANLTQVAEGMKMEWKFDGAGIDVAPIVNSLSEEQRDKIEGKLTFNTNGSGIRVEGEDRPDLDGVIVFDLADGQLKNSKLLNKISEATGTDVFNKLVYKGFHGDIQLADGWANIQQMVVDGNATRLIADGRIGLDGELEVDVQPAIGPEMKDKIGPQNKFGQYLGTVASTASDFMAFPIAVTVRGKGSDTKYGVKPKLPPGVGSLEEVIGGTVGGILDGGKEGGKSLIEGVGGLTKGLLGREKKKE